MERMILLLAIGSWLLANLSLGLGLCVAARNGDAQYDRSTAPAELDVRMPERRELVHGVFEHA